jgi:hypothetical protein
MTIALETLGVIAVFAQIVLIAWAFATTKEDVQ